MLYKVLLFVIAADLTWDPTLDDTTIKENKENTDYIT